MKYLLIFLFACTQTIERAAIQGTQSLEKDQYIVYDQPEFPDDYHQIEYLGNWKHMGHGGSYNINETSRLDTARFAFWGYGVQVRTELMSHHKAYQVIIDGEFIESVNVQNDVNTVKNLTYSTMELKPLTTDDHNHVIELVPDGGYFVLNSLTIHYFVDPTPDDCISDTLYLPSDTVYITGDTIRIIDTVYISDTIIINKIDTIYNTIKEYYLLQPVFNYDTLKL